MSRVGPSRLAVPHGYLDQVSCAAHERLAAHGDAFPEAEEVPLVFLSAHWSLNSPSRPEIRNFSSYTETYHHTSGYDTKKNLEQDPGLTFMMFGFDPWV